MATPKVKSTYSLDLDTIRQLERLADAWKVSKSEALRKAILKASDGGQGPTEGLYALDRLQERLTMSSAAAERFARSVRSERAASSKRREKRR
jgi:hypothetical protein